ncbi:MrcB family domain-containing protein [Chloroflexota bacterium]
MLRENILRVLTSYQQATNEPFANHQLAKFLRHEFPASLRSLVDIPARYKFEGSAGQGQWAPNLRHFMNLVMFMRFTILQTNSPLKTN